MQDKDKLNSSGVAGLLSLIEKRFKNVSRGDFHVPTYTNSTSRISGELAVKVVFGQIATQIHFELLSIFDRQYNKGSKDPNFCARVAGPDALDKIYSKSKRQIIGIALDIYAEAEAKGNIPSCAGNQVLWYFAEDIAKRGRDVMESKLDAEFAAFKLEVMQQSGHSRDN